MPPPKRVENSACSLSISQPQTGASTTSTILKSAKLVAVKTLLPIEKRTIPQPNKNIPIAIDFIASEMDTTNPF